MKPPSNDAHPQWPLLEYYTDPLCERSWDFEPHWRRLRAEFGHRFDWCYRLVGLLSAQPARASASYLACLAMKCAERQSPQAGHLYLCALREAALVYGRSIAQPEELVAIADALGAQVPGLAKQFPAVFDAAAFRQDWAARADTLVVGADGEQAYLRYLPHAPALVLRQAQQPDQVVIIRGQPYEVLLHELAQGAPDLFYVACLVEGGAG